MQIFICQHCGKEHYIIPNTEVKENTVDMILAMCVNYFGIPFEKLKSKNRKREKVYATQFIMFVLRKFTKSTSKSIGRLFNRDHSTVLHAFQKIRGYLDIQDPQACNDYEEIKKLINI